MAMSTNFILLLFSLTFLALLFLCSNSAEVGSSKKNPSEEVEDEKEFDYTEGSDKGPLHWGHMHPEWEACGNGKMQSPIDLLNRRVVISPKLGRLKRKYKPAPVVLKNRGHDIMLYGKENPELQWEGDGGGIYINGTKYFLKQLHWHSPTEHTINGSRYDMELHIFHESKKGGMAVVGILYKFGRPDPFLAKLMPAITIVGLTHEDVGIVNPRKIKFGSREYYRYKGSLTTPPCTEGVIWTIMKKVRTASRKQIHALRQAVNDGFEENARPSQDINSRPIWLYGPKVTELS